MTAEGDKACRLVVEYTLVYVTSVNALLKKAIERGGWGPTALSCSGMLCAPHLPAALSLCAGVAAWSCRSAAAPPGAVQHPLSAALGYAARRCLPAERGLRLQLQSPEWPSAAWGCCQQSAAPQWVEVLAGTCQRLTCAVQGLEAAFPRILIPLWRCWGSSRRCRMGRLHRYLPQRARGHLR